MFNPFSNPEKKAVEERKEIMNQEADNDILQSALHPGNNTDYSESMPLEYKEEKEAFTRWTQELEPDLQMMVHDLRREVMDDRGNWVRQINPVTKKVLRPICNDLLIHKIITILRPNVSKNLINSNYSDTLINIEIRSLCIAFIQNLGYNYEMYGVDKGDLSYIVRLFKSVLRPTFFRALNNGERKHIGTISKEHYIKTNQEAKNKNKSPWLIGG